MLRVQRLSQRSHVPVWRSATPQRRGLRDGNQNPFRSALNEVKKPDRPRRKPSQKQRTQQVAKEAPTPAPPSLAELLFPEETKLHNDRKRALRDVPLLPLDQSIGPPLERVDPGSPRRGTTFRSRALEQQLRSEMAVTGPQTTLLVLRNASTNLTEEDFRRLIPQGKHVEGWNLEQGDILKIIPGRDLATLAKQGVYYLLFSSQLSAFVYQGHVTRIHKLATAHTPSSTASPIPPPPGQLIEGLDAHAAIEAYTLVSPSQKLELRQLKPPLAPRLSALVRKQGIPSIVARPGKSPFEVRLALEGPQVSSKFIKHILIESSKFRALGWSGGDDGIPKITEWETGSSTSWQSRSEESTHVAKDGTGNDHMQSGGQSVDRHSRVDDQGWRHRDVADPVYIVGFHTENAAHSFVQHWHRRPMVGTKGAKGAMGAEGDLPPIANVELLW